MTVERLGRYLRHGTCERNCRDHCCWLPGHDEHGRGLVCQHLTKDAGGLWLCTVRENRPDWCLAYEPFPDKPEAVGGTNCSYRFEGVDGD